MARILRFARERAGNVDAAKVWEYVLPRLEFPLPDFITREIDSLLGNFWNAAKTEIDFYECVGALESLRTRHIMIPAARREKIVSLVFEYLEQNGFLDRVE